MNSIDPFVPQAFSRREKGTERGRAIRFGAVLAAVAAVAGAWTIFRGGSHRTGYSLIALGVAFLSYCAAHPRGALRIRAAWLRFGSALGRINSVVLLAVLYVVVVTPFGVLARVFGRRRLKPSPGASYFVAREAAPDPKHFEHPY